MITACTNRIKEILLASGVPEKQIHLDASGFSAHKGTPGAVIYAGIDKTTPSGRLVLNELAPEAGVRRKVHLSAVRELAIGVVIRHKTQAEAEAITTALVDQIAPGFAHEGFPIECRRSSTDWLQEKSVSRTMAEASVALTFIGGIYRERLVRVLKSLRVEGEKLT